MLCKATVNILGYRAGETYNVDVEDDAVKRLLNARFLDPVYRSEAPKGLQQPAPVESGESKKGKA